MPIKLFKKGEMVMEYLVKCTQVGNEKAWRFFKPGETYVKVKVSKDGKKEIETLDSKDPSYEHWQEDCGYDGSGQVVVGDCEKATEEEMEKVAFKIIKKTKAIYQAAGKIKMVQKSGDTYKITAISKDTKELDQTALYTFVNLNNKPQGSVTLGNVKKDEKGEDGTPVYYAKYKSINALATVGKNKFLKDTDFEGKDITDEEGNVKGKKLGVPHYVLASKRYNHWTISNEDGKIGYLYKLQNSSKGVSQENLQIIPSDQKLDVKDDYYFKSKTGYIYSFKLKEISTSGRLKIKDADDVAKKDKSIYLVDGDEVKVLVKGTEMKIESNVKMSDFDDLPEFNDKGIAKRAKIGVVCSGDLRAKDNLKDIILPDTWIVVELSKNNNISVSGMLGYLQNKDQSVVKKDKDLKVGEEYYYSGFDELYKIKIVDNGERFNKESTNKLFSMTAMMYKAEYELLGKKPEVKQPEQPEKTVQAKQPEQAVQVDGTVPPPPPMAPGIPAAPVAPGVPAAPAKGAAVKKQETVRPDVQAILNAADVKAKFKNTNAAKSFSTKPGVSGQALDMNEVMKKQKEIKKPNPNKKVVPEEKPAVNTEMPSELASVFKKKGLGSKQAEQQPAPAAEAQPAKPAKPVKPAKPNVEHQAAPTSVPPNKPLPGLAELSKSDDVAPAVEPQPAPDAQAAVVVESGAVPQPQEAPAPEVKAEDNNAVQPIDQPATGSEPKVEADQPAVASQPQGKLDSKSKDDDEPVKKEKAGLKANENFEKRITIGNDRIQDFKSIINKYNKLVDSVKKIKPKEGIKSTRVEDDNIKRLDEGRFDEKDLAGLQGKIQDLWKEAHTKPTAKDLEKQKIKDKEDELAAKQARMNDRVISRIERFVAVKNNGAPSEVVDKEWRYLVSIYKSELSAIEREISGFYRSLHTAKKFIKSIFKRSTPKKIVRKCFKNAGDYLKNDYFILGNDGEVKNEFKFTDLVDNFNDMKKYEPEWYNNLKEVLKDDNMKKCVKDINKAEKKVKGSLAVVFMSMMGLKSSSLIIEAADGLVSGAPQGIKISDDDKDKINPSDLKESCKNIKNANLKDLKAVKNATDNALGKAIKGVITGLCSLDDTEYKNIKRVMGFSSHSELKEDYTNSNKK